MSSKGDHRRKKHHKEEEEQDSQVEERQKRKHDADEEEEDQDRKSRKGKRGKKRNDDDGDEGIKSDEDASKNRKKSKKELDDSIPATTSSSDKKLVAIPEPKGKVEERFNRAMRLVPDKLQEAVYMLSHGFDDSVLLNHNRMEAYLNFPIVELIGLVVGNPNLRPDDPVIQSLHPFKHDFTKFSFKKAEYKSGPVKGHNVSFGILKSTANEKAVPRMIVNSPSGRVTFCHLEPTEELDPKDNTKKWNNKFFAGLSCKLPFEHTSYWPAQQALTKLLAVFWNLWTRRLLTHTWVDPDLREKVWGNSFSTSVVRKVEDGYIERGQDKPNKTQFEADVLNAFLSGASKFFNTKTIKGTTERDTFVACSRELFMKMKDEDIKKLDQKQLKPDASYIMQKHFQGFTHKPPRIEDANENRLELRTKDGQFSIKRGDVAFFSNMVLGFKVKDSTPGEYGLICRFLPWRNDSEMTLVKAYEYQEDSTTKPKINTAVPQGLDNDDDENGKGKEQDNEDDEAHGIF